MSQEDRSRPAPSVSSRDDRDDIEEQVTGGGGPQSPAPRSLAPPRLDEMSPQSLYDKCLALARNLW